MSFKQSLSIQRCAANRPWSRGKSTTTGEFNPLRQLGAKDLGLVFQQPVLGGQVLPRTGCEQGEKRMNDGPHGGSGMAIIQLKIGVATFLYPAETTSLRIDSKSGIQPGAGNWPRLPSINRNDRHALPRSK